ncbi:MAG: sterol desaturase family protein [Verrucomicrobiales bacterium]
MIDFIENHEASVRILFFAGILVLMTIWEIVSPRRRREIPRLLRWSNNLGIVVIDTLLVRLAFPTVVAAFAVVAAERGWGLFNVVEVPFWLAFVLSFLVFDLVIYLQHVMFHAVPALWRLHRMHHADLEIDVTTGLRFHPLEILLSMVVKFAVVAVLGPPAVAVIVFEIALNGTSMFNHGNVKMPRPLDRLLRWIVVTPDMHRVHHSILKEETNSNFGFNLPWWDRGLGTYRDQPAAGHEGMTIGIEQFRNRRELWLDRMLWQPWRRDAGTPEKARPVPEGSEDRETSPKGRD